MQYKQLSESENEDSMFTAGLFPLLFSLSLNNLSNPRPDVDPSPCVHRASHRGRLLHLVLLDLRSRSVSTSGLVGGPCVCSPAHPLTPRPRPRAEDTPFEGGVFQAELKFPRDYPLNPPKVRERGETAAPRLLSPDPLLVRRAPPPPPDSISPSRWRRCASTRLCSTPTASLPLSRPPGAPGLADRTSN